MVLILKNVKFEGPGTILDFLIDKKIPYKVVELGDGEYPMHLEDYDTVIMMGGPMAIYEMDMYPFLKKAESIINWAITSKKRILGICLGAQMIAHCFGARVYPGDKKEIGWYDIELTNEGLLDPCMRALAKHPQTGDVWKRFKVFHWHGDTFDLPKDAVRLASSNLYENQAFRIGESIYALQFHIEVNKELLTEWFKDDPSSQDVLREYDEIRTEYVGRANQFYCKFFEVNP